MSLPLSPDVRVDARRHRHVIAARWLSAALLTGLLAACSSSPPLQYFQLRADPPAGAAAPTTPSASTGRWQIGPVQLPEYLDRDTLLLPTGQAGLRALNGQRWAEPLRDAVPRVLRMDLARLRGADQVWAIPTPAGVSIARQLRVEIQQLDATEDGSAVVLQARWWLLDPAGAVPAEVHDSRLSAPARSAAPDDLVAAHRAVLWLLARDIATRAGGA